jgi:hypothetical protein
MALGKEAIDYPCDLYQEFARQRPLVRVEVSEVSIPNLSTAYLPSNGCIYDKQKQRSPNYVLRHVSAELRDQSKSLVLHSKHNGLHRAQRWRDVKVAPHGDRESSQIYLA